jgi:hypothetical protein
LAWALGLPHVPQGDAQKPTPDPQPGPDSQAADPNTGGGPNQGNVPYRAPPPWESFPGWHPASDTFYPLFSNPSPDLHKNLGLYYVQPTATSQILWSQLIDHTKHINGRAVWWSLSAIERIVPNLKKDMDAETVQKAINTAKNYHTAVKMTHGTFGDDYCAPHIARRIRRLHESSLGGKVDRLISALEDLQRDIADGERTGRSFKAVKSAQISITERRYKGLRPRYKTLIRDSVLETPETLLLNHLADEEASKIASAALNTYSATQDAAAGATTANLGDESTRQHLSKFESATREGVISTYLPPNPEKDTPKQRVLREVIMALRFDAMEREAHRNDDRKSKDNKGNKGYGKKEGHIPDELSSHAHEELKKNTQATATPAYIDRIAAYAGSLHAAYTGSDSSWDMRRAMAWWSWFDANGIPFTPHPKTKWYRWLKENLPIPLPGRRDFWFTQGERSTWYRQNPLSAISVFLKAAVVGGATGYAASSGVAHLLPEGLSAWAAYPALGLSSVFAGLPAAAVGGMASPKTVLKVAFGVGVLGGLGVLAAGAFGFGPGAGFFGLFGTYVSSNPILALVPAVGAAGVVTTAVGQGKGVLGHLGKFIMSLATFLSTLSWVTKDGLRGPIPFIDNVPVVKKLNAIPRTICLASILGATAVGPAGELIEDATLKGMNGADRTEFVSCKEGGFITNLSAFSRVGNTIKCGFEQGGLGAAWLLGAWMNTSGAWLNINAGAFPPLTVWGHVFGWTNTDYATEVNLRQDRHDTAKFNERLGEVGASASDVTFDSVLTLPEPEKKPDESGGADPDAFEFDSVPALPEPEKKPDESGGADPATFEFGGLLNFKNIPTGPSAEKVAQSFTSTASMQDSPAAFVSVGPGWEPDADDDGDRAADGTPETELA